MGQPGAGIFIGQHGHAGPGDVAKPQAVPPARAAARSGFRGPESGGTTGPVGSPVALRGDPAASLFGAGAGFAGKRPESREEHERMEAEALQIARKAAEAEIEPSLAGSGS